MRGDGCLCAFLLISCSLGCEVGESGMVEKSQNKSRVGWGGGPRVHYSSLLLTHSCNN